jgi:CubicO group peptidase (beta-lactamase class C family)
MRTSRALAVALVLSVVVAACSSGDDDSAGSGSGSGSGGEAAAGGGASDVRFPGTQWDKADPAGEGFDPAGLARLDHTAQASGSNCLVVTRDGAVVDEQYWNGSSAQTPREAFSVTKSVTSTLVGIAQDAGKLAVDDPADDYIPQWKGTDSAPVTVKNLVSMDSGRHWDFNTDYGRMAIRERDKTAFAIGLGQDAPPGKVWAYNNSAVQTLSALLQKATGQDPADYAKTELFDPIGMSESSMNKDGAGNTLTFMGLHTTCLDLARFGYLMLNHGTWGGDQVVSSDWVEQATGRSSTKLNAAYGYLWWLNREGPIGSPALATTGVNDAATRHGQLVPDAPADTFWALGFNNQVVAVIPSQHIVAVRMGPKPPANAPFTQQQLTDGVLDALVSK